MASAHKNSDTYFFIKRPNLAIVISLLITLVGGIAIFMLPVEQYPNLVPPRVFVKFSYPGASAQTISETVIAPLEVQLNGVEGMLYMTSTASSSSGTGTVSVFFDLETDPDIALVNVNNKVNLAQSLLPEAVRQQGITVNKSAAASLLTIALFSPKGQYDVIYLDNYLQTNIVEEIKRIPGVGECVINGSMDYAMRIWLDPGKMAKYNLIPADVAAIIRDQNAQFSPGRLGSLPDIVDTELSWQIDTQGRLITPEEFGNIILRAQADGSTLRLKDIARVGLGSKNYNIVSSLNGKPARMAEVSLLPGANALETGKRIEAKLEELSQNFPHVALTLTPALCALILKPHDPYHKPARFFVWYNWWFARVTRRYIGLVRTVKNCGVRSMLLFVCMLLAMGWLFKAVPTSLVPKEDQGRILGVAILADGAIIPRTDAAMNKVRDQILANPIVQDVTTFSGFDMTSPGIKSNYATFFVMLKNWSERTEKHESGAALAKQVRAMGAKTPEANIVAFEPAAISGMGNTGGFDGYIQNRGTGSLEDLQKWTSTYVEAARKRPEIGFVRNLFSTGAPQLYAHLDRERCMALGVNVSDVFRTMQSTFGSSYVNDYNYIGRTFQVVMQAEAKYRMQPDNLADVHVRNKKGEMIPLNALVTLERRTAPQVVTRYNVFPASHFLGAPAEGYTSGQAIAAMEEVAAEIFPPEYTLGWAGAALQEKLISTDISIIFVLALLMVFLILVAQYESWALPMAVLTAVPFGIFGAIVATWMRDLANDIYFQVALVTVVGLAAKNAILIVEFAAEAWRNGKGLDMAAMYAARLRFRPIIMTSLAFIIGCVPLAISTGAGANSRHAIGTAVIGGMLMATFVATVFVPFFFKKIMHWTLRLRGKKELD